MRFQAKGRAIYCNYLKSARFVADNTAMYPYVTRRRYNIRV